MNIKNILITNIKISFNNKKKVYIRNNTDILTYYTNNIRIIKFNNYTCSLMGKNLNFVNLTGLKTFKEINNCLNIFCEKTNVNRNNIIYTIDSISSTCKIKPGLRSIFIKYQKNIYFSIFIPLKFCAVIIKFKNIGTCLYFNNSGCLNIIGTKQKKDSYKILLIINKFLNEIV